MKRFDIYEFLGEPVSNAFNPPGCPIPRHGEPIDISAVSIYPYMEDTTPDGGDPITEIWFTLGERDENEGNLTNFVETDILTVDQDDPLAMTVYELKRDEQDPRLERIRQAFIARTRQCPGAQNGECWALGTNAVRKVLSDLDGTAP